ncbi:MAG TPA: preprotein translocase subunit SecY [Actinomycetes bacterium]|nr:preprotein translocase subunit SecY [Actinomycetes bacterium]
MLRAFVNALKIPDLRGKILFTLCMIAIYRLGSYIPVPGADYEEIQRFLDRAQNAANSGAFNLINLFSGGALTQFAIFALGIMPYITSSIIMQLLGVVIPRLEELRKEGETGQKKLQQYTRYVTIGLAVLQSAAIVTLARSKNLLPDVDVFPDMNAGRFALAVLTLIAGTAMIMWLGELITQRGIGNGMSILIFSSIVSQLPSQGARILQERGAVLFSVLCGFGLVIIIAVIFVEQAQRRIPVQYAKRMVGRRMFGGSSTYIPLKVNQAGVIPIIFASSLLYLPVLLTSIFNKQWLNDLTTRFFEDGHHPVYIISYFLLIIAFAYFYNSIAFNPIDTADNMKKYGGFIPGIRPGRQTAEYLNAILTRITLPGALFLGVIAVLPFILLATNNVQKFPFGGTAILITVGVGLETMKQIESQLLMRNYEGFLR